MYVVLGGTGHVGSAVVRTLVQQGERPVVVTHDAKKVEAINAAGGEAAVVDVLNVDNLKAVLRQGRRAYLLNPPAPPHVDTDAEEKKTVAALVAALAGSGLEKVVVHSTYGARPADGVGDLGVLHDLEQGVAASGIPAATLRAAYYFSNWDGALEKARAEGVIDTMFPADFALPMVSPDDLGSAGARLLSGPLGDKDIHYVEGPRRYSSADVAAAFARALDRPVRVATTPRDQWDQAFRGLGFSAPAAAAYVRMTAATLDDGDFPPVEAVERGQTTLDSHVQALVDDALKAGA
jgi:uncharacterized protein YbjT (DUF2867 family)